VDIPRLQSELYGRLFVEMIKQGIIPESLIEAMHAEFEHLGDLATRDADKQHYEGLAAMAATLLARAELDTAEEAAKDARSRFRVISGDGGNKSD